MALDWSNEPYVRLYKRETDEDLLLSWEARAVWHEVLKKCDQSGLLETRRGVRGLAALIRVPLDVVERVLQELIEDGRIKSVPNVGFVVPNYVEANFTPRGVNARQAESRMRRRAEALTGEPPVAECHSRSHDVTRGHTESHAVTHSFIHSEQIIHQPASPASDALSQVQQKCDALQLESPPVRKSRKKQKHALPGDWSPRDQERELARQLDLDCDHEAREFVTYWRGEGGIKADWDATFENRLLAVSKRSRSRWNGNGRTAEQPRHIPEM